MKRSETCSACKIRPVRSPKQRYCKECHAADQRDRQKQMREDAKAFRSMQERIST